MKKIGIIALAALLASPAFVRADAPVGPPDASAGGLRFSIAVTKFENHANYSGPFQLSDTWGSMLTDSLQQSGHFIVLGEAEMRDAAMKEQDFAKSGRVAGGGSEAEINAVIYVVDSTTGQVVASHKVLGKVKSSGLSVGFSNRDWSGDMGGFKKTNVGTAMEQAIDDGVAFIVAQIPSLHWSGNVILVKGPMVYINRGTREGVAIGQTFKVGTSEILRDPATGETLDVAFTEKGRIKVDNAKEKISICSVVSGDGLESGMSVAPPTP
jgi:curli biogenesis system outer membrane secretion channel CsgG